METRQSAPRTGPPTFVPYSYYRFVSSMCNASLHELVIVNRAKHTVTRKSSKPSHEYSMFQKQNDEWPHRDYANERWNNNWYRHAMYKFSSLVSLQLNLSI